MLALANIAVLIISYVMLARTASTRGLRVALAAGALFIAAAIAIRLSSAARDRIARVLPSRTVRGALALAPWIVLAALAWSRMLWWTQRPASLRFFLLYVLANWSVACCFVTSSRNGVRVDDARRAVLVLAALIGALGIEGAAFGVTAFGCGVSMLLALVAVVTLLGAAFGTRAAALKACVASLAAFLAVGVLEVTVRALRLGQNVQEVDSREYARQFYSLTPPRAAFINKPNTLDEFPPALVSINSRGIRGPELADPQTDILLIGDSMIEARQFPWERTVGPQLQQALRERAVPARVVAHGMRGWSPLLEWNWYLKVGRQLKPRTVFLSFFWNDLWTSGEEVRTFSARLDENGRPTHFDVPVDANWIWYKQVRVIRLAADAWQRLNIEQARRAFSSMASARASDGAMDDAAADRAARTLTERPLSPGELEAMLTKPADQLPPDLNALAQTVFWPSFRPLSLWTEAQKTAAGHTETELSRFADDVRADGGRLVIVYVPNPLQIGGKECSVGRLFARVDTNVVLPPDSGIQAWLRGVGARQGIDVLDPSGAMRDAKSAAAVDAGPLYLRADCHWTERGHVFMANYLADWYARGTGKR